MTSNKKILTSVDLSRNDIYNVSRVIGSEYTSVGHDLEVASTSDGKVFINSPDGEVRVLVGDTSWTNGTVTDNTTQRHNLSSGLTVDDLGVIIANASSTGRFIADASNVSLKASSTDVADKTSITLSSTDDSVVVKGAIISEAATTSATIDAPKLVIGSTATTDLNVKSSTALGLNITAKASTTYTNVNGISRTCNSLTQSDNALIKVADITDMDVAGNVSVAHGDSYDKSTTFKTSLFKLESNEVNVDHHGDTLGSYKFKAYTGASTTNNYQYNNKNSKAAKNSKGYLIVDDITSNVELDAQVVDVHDNFDINVSTSKHATVRTPEANTIAGALDIKAGGTYTFAENHGSSLSTTPLLQITASTSGSLIVVKNAIVNNAEVINGSSHTTEADTALKVDGAATITKDVFLNGNISFNSSTGKITNTNASKLVEIGVDNIKLTGANTTVSGSAAVNIASPKLISAEAIGSSAAASIKVGTTSSSLAFELAASTTSSTISVTNLNAKNISSTSGSFSFNGTSFSAISSGASTLNGATVGINGTTSVKISSTSNGFEIDAGATTTGSSLIKATNVTASGALSGATATVTGAATIGGNATVGGDLQLSGSGLITSTNSTTKQIQIFGDSLVDIRTQPTGSTVNSIIYANDSTTYINGTHIKAANQIKVGDVVDINTSSATVNVPITTSKKFTISNDGADALAVTGNVAINSGTANTTTIKGATVTIQPTATVVGTTSTDVSISGKNNLVINSSSTTNESFIRATNLKADNSITTSNFTIYYDSATSSLVFAQGS